MRSFDKVLGAPLLQYAAALEEDILQVRRRKSQKFSKVNIKMCVACRINSHRPQMQAKASQVEILTAQISFSRFFLHDKNAVHAVISPRVGKKATNYRSVFACAIPFNINGIKVHGDGMNN